MQKHRIILILIVSVFIAALSFILLKLDKKTNIPATTAVLLKNNTANADSILQVHYGDAICFIAAPLFYSNNANHCNVLFLQNKLYAAAANKPALVYCTSDSSLAITLP